MKEALKFKKIKRKWEKIHIYIFFRLLLLSFDRGYYCVLGSTIFIQERFFFFLIFIVHRFSALLNLVISFFMVVTISCEVLI